MYITKRLIVVGIVAIIIGGYLLSVFGHYKTDIIQAIQDMAIKMRERRFGAVWMCAIATICGTPPILGFTFAVTITGFIYGFPSGCLPATTGALLSTLISFGLIRKFHFSKYIKLSDKRQEMYQAMQDAIMQGGFKMILLIRICPLPWQLTNLILPLVPTVTWKSYIVSAFISSFKFNMDIWVGSQLANLSDPDLPPEAHRVTLIYMGVGVVILALSGYWIYRLTMQKIKEQQQKLLLSQQEDENQRLLNSEVTSINSEEEEDDNNTVIVGTKSKT